MTGCARTLLSIAGSAAAAFAACLAPALAQDEVVDVALVIAADVSLSMSYEELQIQRDGYVAALTHDTVIAAIEDGAHGRIALAMFEWAGDQTQHLIVPWTMVASRADAEAIAARLAASVPNSARRTSISGALDFAADLFAEGDFRALRRVVDISGDGPNNQGGPVVAARERLTSQGITVNGLPLMTSGGFPTAFDVSDLDTYYTNCVIGGPGAFMIPVNDWGQFPEAIRRKLVLELAGSAVGEAADPPVLHAQMDAYDCLIGEKMWQNRMMRFQSP